MKVNCFKNPSIFLATYLLYLPCRKFWSNFGLLKISHKHLILALFWLHIYSQEEKRCSIYHKLQVLKIMCFLRFRIARIRKVICVEIARYLSIHGSSRVAKNVLKILVSYLLACGQIWRNLSVDGCHFWLWLKIALKNHGNWVLWKEPDYFSLRFWVYLAKSSIGYVRAVHDLQDHESGGKKNSSLATCCCCCRRPRCLLLLLLQKLDHREFKL
jgi:hypothetical protein